MCLHFVGYFFIVLKKCQNHGKCIAQMYSFGANHSPLQKRATTCPCLLRLRSRPGCAEVQINK